MEVETYEVISADPSAGDNALADELSSPEAVELITQLGLTGQEKLLNTSEPDAPVTRNPYRLMTELEMSVYAELFPVHTKIAEYSDGPIPLRVLQVAAHAGDQCGELEVWHPRAGQDDPVLVGRVKSAKGYGYQLYLLARWGVALVPFETLRLKAIEAWKSKKVLAAREMVRNAQREEQDIDLLAEKHFSGLNPALTF